MKIVPYSQVHPALIDPVHSVVGHDEEGNIVTDRVIMEDSPDTAAFCGYMSVIKVLGSRALFDLKGILNIRRLLMISRRETRTKSSFFSYGMSLLVRMMALGIPNGRLSAVN